MQALKSQQRAMPLVGSSPSMVDLKAEVERVARSDAKVLITGESGCGKELVANAVHNGSSRTNREFVAVNCAGLPETLLESELFGHVKGSFTGAYRDKLGKLELADQGTMFLDEIGEMTLRMQGLLLRFLETGELQKVGADRVVGRVDVRVIAATNRNLREMIGQGTFREDLFYRLNVIHLVVPPLRERREDIVVLALHFLQQFTAARNGDGNGNGHGHSQALNSLSSLSAVAGDANSARITRTGLATLATVRDIAPDALQALKHHNWPGNVRELQNVIERLIVTVGADCIQVADLPAEIRSK